MYLKKKILICSLFFVLCFLFFVFPVFAATPPEQNPMCWTMSACKDAIEGRSWTFKNNWEEKSPGDICAGATGEKMGVCIPAGKTSLSIKIGEADTDIQNLGDYIKIIYRYLVGIGAIVAVVLLIKGGFEWMTSAGSPERVKSAQSTIGSALMGLLLLLGSYTLLYTINPDLVRLRLPGIYMIRKIVLGSTYCQDQTEKVAYAGISGTPVLEPFPGNEKFTIDPKWAEKELGKEKTLEGWIKFYNIVTEKKGVLHWTVPTCGYKYYFKDGGGETCAGLFCAPIKTDAGAYLPAICFNEGKEKWKCTLGKFSGNLKDPNNLFGDSPLEAVWLAEVCADGEVMEYSDVSNKINRLGSSNGDVDDIDKQTSTFLMKQVPHSDYCNSRGGQAGYYIIITLDDKNDLFGTADDDYAVGCVNSNSSDCSSNLAKIVNKNQPPDKDSLMEDDFREALIENGANAVEKIKNNLIPFSAFGQGKIIEINISGDQFPPD